MPLFDKHIHIGETRTLHGVNRLMLDHDDYALPDAQSPYGYLRERHIIGRYSKINGGVYIGGHSREAILVDDTLENSLILKVYQILVSQINTAGDYSTIHILNEVMRHTRHYISFADITYPVGQDDELPLDYNIKNRKGVCRHQNLLVGYLVEKLISEGFLQGNTSLERNEQSIITKDEKLITLLNAHVWCRFIDQHGAVYILDVSHNKQCLILHPQNKYQWDYNRYRPDSSLPKNTIPKAGCSSKISIEHFMQIFCDNVSELPVLNLVNNENKLFAEYIDLNLTKRFVSLDSFNEKYLSVGRDPSNRITNVNPALSRFHCRIHHNGRTVQLMDCNSKNGTHYRISPFDERVNATHDKIQNVKVR